MYNLGDNKRGANRMAVSLEKRVAELERQVARLQEPQRTGMSAPAGREWVDDLYGAFAGDPVFENRQ